MYRHSFSVTGDVSDEVEVLAAISRSRSERSHVRLAARKCSDCHVFRTRSGSGRADVRLATDLFKEPFPDPSEAVPAAEEDEAADVLVEGKYGPHGHETPAQADAEDIASDHLYSPHYDDSDEYREIYIPGASEGIHAEVRGLVLLAGVCERT